MKLSDGIVKYLGAYGEPEAALVPELPLTRWDAAVAIPALAESATLPSCLDTMAAAARGDGLRSVAVVCVNAAPERTAEEHLDNARLLAWLRERLGNPVLPPPFFTLGPYATGLDVLVIDRARPDRALPEKSGVGLARKIAGDVALGMFARGTLGSPWLQMTDADARVTCGYFDTTPLPPFRGLDVCRNSGEVNPETVAALVHPFVHVADEGWEEPSRLYDAFLRYYENGLVRAGSPYAFQTVGSTLAVRYEAYAAVRGFPQVAAGEDFYLLNKLAKVGAVAHARSPIELKGRPSSRVPFGTGAGILKIRRERDTSAESRWYAPETFEWLGRFLEAVDRWSESPAENWRDAVDDERIAILAADLGADRAFASALRSRPSAAARRRHLHEWFDAFRTLKFVHGVRDRWLPAVEARHLVR